MRKLFSIVLFALVHTISIASANPPSIVYNGTTLTHVMDLKTVGNIFELCSDYVQEGRQEIIDFIEDDNKDQIELIQYCLLNDDFYECEAPTSADLIKYINSQLLRNKRSKLLKSINSQYFTLIDYIAMCNNIALVYLSPQEDSNELLEWKTTKEMLSSEDHSTVYILTNSGGISAFQYQENNIKLAGKKRTASYVNGTLPLPKRQKAVHKLLPIEANKLISAIMQKARRSSTVSNETRRQLLLIGLINANYIQPINDFVISNNLNYETTIGVVKRARKLAGLANPNTKITDCHRTAIENLFLFGRETARQDTIAYANAHGINRNTALTIGYKARNRIRDL
jgi:hypothetical protein